jgi:hypothetical protein
MRILRMPPPMPNEKIRQIKINRKWEAREGADSQAIGLQIIKDIDPYRAVAVDVATDSAPAIGSRREHREFLKRNGYHEVGNEKIGRRRQEFTPVRDDLRRAVQEVKNR